MEKALQIMNIELACLRKNLNNEFIIFITIKIT